MSRRNRETGWVCTLCGGPREWGRSTSHQHYASERHQLAVVTWDASHKRAYRKYPVTHHDGHVALKIPCGCEQ